MHARLQAGLLDARGELPGSKAAFLGASIATAIGSLVGTSPVIIHNETCAGIAEGGRTGLTAVVVALYFSLSVWFVPIFSAVPLTATAPALVIVGAFMMGPAGAMDWDNFKESLPAYLTIAVMPLTYSIANGVVAGMVAFGLIELFTTPLLAQWFGGLVARAKGREGLHQPLTGTTSIHDMRSVSASSSPHAMVRPPSMTARPSFNGLSALGGKAASPSTSPSSDCYSAPAPPTQRLYPTFP